MFTKKKEIGTSNVITNDIWSLDTDQTQKHGKITFGTTLSALETLGLFNPWWADFSVGAPTIYYTNTDYENVFGFVHHSSSPDGTKIRLWVANK